MGNRDGVPAHQPLGVPGLTTLPSRNGRQVGDRQSPGGLAPVLGMNEANSCTERKRLGWGWFPPPCESPTEVGKREPVGMLTTARQPPWRHNPVPLSRLTGKPWHRRHYARRTIGTYEGWLRRFLGFHQLRQPREMGSLEINAFLTHLAARCQLHTLSRVNQVDVRLTNCRRATSR